MTDEQLADRLIEERQDAYWEARAEEEEGYEPDAAGTFKGCRQ